jgi:hypothetical protein
VLTLKTPVEVVMSPSKGNMYNLFHTAAEDKGIEEQFTGLGVSVLGSSRESQVAQRVHLQGDISHVEIILISVSGN